MTGESCQMDIAHKSFFLVSLGGPSPCKMFQAMPCTALPFPRSLGATGNARPRGTHGNHVVE